MSWLLNSYILHETVGSQSGERSTQNFSNQSSILRNRAIFDPFDPHFDPLGAPKRVNFLYVLRINATIVFLMLKTCIQNFSNQSSILSNRAIFDPHFDPLGAPKRINFLYVLRIDVKIVFSHAKDMLYTKFQQPIINFKQPGNF